MVSLSFELYHQFFCFKIKPKKYAFFSQWNSVPRLKSRVANVIQIKCHWSKQFQFFWLNGTALRTLEWNILPSHNRWHWKNWTQIEFIIIKWTNNFRCHLNWNWGAATPEITTICEKKLISKTCHLAYQDNIAHSLIHSPAKLL